MTALLPQTCRRNRVVIDLQALISNFDVVQALAPGQRTLCMIKANAYGHGMIAVARTLRSRATSLGVASVEEGVTLREAGIDGDIVVMSGLFCHEHIELMRRYALTPVVHSLYQLDMLLDQACNWHIPLWLKINSGMNRLGLKPQQLQQAGTRLAQQFWNFSEINLLSHLAEANEPHRDFTEQQIATFRDAIADFAATHISLSNSAEAMTTPHPDYDTIRPGISLYGISPINNPQHLSRYSLTPVMTFQARIIALQSLQTGESVGYQRSWQAARPATIAIVAAGYGDGYPQHAPNGTPVLIRNQRCPLAGQVSMDMLSVDVSTLERVEIGDMVTLWGKGLPAETVAAAMGISPYGLVSAIHERVYRDYVNGS